MGRIRTVKPDIFADEDLGELPALVRWFYVGLLTQADREGRLEYRPKRLKALLLPYDDDADVPAIVEHLVDRRFLIRYVVAGRAYLAVRSWKKHQRINQREPASTLPAPPESDHAPPPDPPKPPAPEPDLHVHARDDEPTNGDGARARTCAHVGKGKEGKGKEGEGKGGGGARALHVQPPPPLPARFGVHRGLVHGPDPRIRHYGQVEVWQEDHARLAARLNRTDADEVLDRWYEQVQARWARDGTVPTGKARDVWQREFDREFGTKPPTPAELKQAGELRRRVYGRCPHGAEHDYDACLRQIVVEELRRPEAVNT